MSQRHAVRSIGFLALPLMAFAVLSSSTSAAVGQESPAARLKSNFQEIGLAMQQYHGAKGAFPAAANYSADGKPLLSWRVHILPYMGQDALYRRFKLDEPWDSEHNRKLIPLIPKTYIDPLSADAVKGGKTTYVVPVGEKTIFDAKEGTKMSKIPDGTSNTLLVVDVPPESAVIWTKPEDWSFQVKEPGKGLLEGKREQFRAAYADGSVRTLPVKIDLDDLRRLVQKDDGEVLSQKY